MQRLNRHIRLISRLAWRYLLVWTGDAVSIGITALLLPGIYFLRDSPLWYLTPFVVALLFGLLNALVRPVLILLLLPVTFVTLGLATLVLNAALFYLMHVLVGAFVIEHFVAAVAGVLTLTLVNTLLGNLLPVGDDYSFYAALLNKFGSLTGPKSGRETPGERGLVIVQIDGLSRVSLERALHKGKMPFVANMLGRRQFAIDAWFCGLPSQTSAIQAAMFYGDNVDIPGFRWYDKRAGKLVVSSNSSDLSAVDERLARTHESILENGTSIISLVHGNARKKLLTISSMGDRSIGQHRAELQDLAIFWMHPYLYTRTVIMMGWDFLVDRVQALIDRFRREGPKLVRSWRFSVNRALGNTLFRELGTFFVIEDITRGMPVIYTNYLGYDQVSHYSGPNSYDALSTLTTIDRRLRKIWRTIASKSPLEYDLVILSDHGQTRSAPFRAVYGCSLLDLIQETLEQPRVEHAGEATDLGYLGALLRDVRMAEAAYGSMSIRGGRRTLERLHRTMAEEVVDDTRDGAVVVCPSGNLAHVYFTETEARMTTEQILDRHPTLLENLVSHEGIGFVITRNTEGEHLMMGKAGMRRLRSGEVEGIDPLVPYAGAVSIDTLSRTLARLSEFGNSGDLIVNGRLMQDGSVITFEDQRGTHGGLGGEQTRPFVIYSGRFRRSGVRVTNLPELHAFLEGLA